MSKTLRTSGPSYNTRDPVPVRYYKWKCPKCGDICEDPENIHESMCHSGHEVKLTLAHDGGIYVSMVAEYAVPEFVPIWTSHHYASEGGRKVHVVLNGKAKLNRRQELVLLCGRSVGLANSGDAIPDFEAWLATGQREVCAHCIRKARKLLK